LACHEGRDPGGAVNAGENTVGFGKHELVGRKVECIAILSLQDGEQTTVKKTIAVMNEEEMNITVAPGDMRMNCLSRPLTIDRMDEVGRRSPIYVFKALCKKTDVCQHMAKRSQWNTVKNNDKKTQ
jgi:hypothetical protein